MAFMRATLLAKQVTAMAPRRPRKASTRPARAWPSEPVEPSTCALVLSHTMASTPSSPKRLRACEVGGLADQRFRIELPVAGVQQIAGTGADRERDGFRHRVGDRDGLDIERTDAEAPADREGVDLHGTGDAGFLQALADQVRREGSGVDRAFQPGPEVMDGADMVFVGMGDHEADDVVHPLFDEGRIDHEGLDFRHVVAAEGDAGIDDQPFSGMTVEGHVHADAVAAAEREKDDLVGAGNRATYGAGRRSTGGLSDGSWEYV